MRKCWNEWWKLNYFHYSSISKSNYCWRFRHCAYGYIAKSGWGSFVAEILSQWWASCALEDEIIPCVCIEYNSRALTGNCICHGVSIWPPRRQRRRFSRFAFYIWGNCRGMVATYMNSPEIRTLIINGWPAVSRVQSEGEASHWPYPSNSLSDLNWPAAPYHKCG